MVTESQHPLVKQALAALRDVGTRPANFRRLVRVLAGLLAYEATADLATEELEVTTPMGVAEGARLIDRVGVVPILRAGLGMAEGILDLLPEAEVWHVGLYRDEKTLMPREYYNKIPPRPRMNLALLLDPMLATGGSAIRACEVVKAAGVPRLKLIALIAAPEGVAAMRAKMPDVSIHVAAIDDCLNEIGFIYPGLGDAGDRQFNTESTGD